jgi:hypothetical protein
MNASFLKALSPLASLAILAAPVTAATQDTQATYRVTFTASWSAASHPGAYPFGAHFSPLIGGTHNSSASFWEPGGIASFGIERMAETGQTSPLQNEVIAAMNAGNAGQVILDPVVLSSPGQTDTTFTLTDAHPLVSLVTMIAPSPDWFVGVHAYPLLENGVWVDNRVVELFAYDAGTDSGTNFNSANLNTSPKEPISLITGGPFFGTTPLGTFTFERLESSLLYGCGTNPAGSMSIASGRPKIGTTLQVAVSDPSGTLLTPASTFLAITPNPHPAFPCGRLIFNWGLSAMGTPGELLVFAPLNVLPGTQYSGTPVVFTLPIPNDPLLAGERYYLQGLLIDSNGRRGLTEGLEVLMGQ